MASQPLAPNPPTCRFVKDNGEFCKRTVSWGEGRCWQHARSCKHRIKSLTRSQTVVFIIAIASLLTGLVIGIPSLYFSYVGSRNVKPSMAKTPPPSEEGTIKVFITWLTNPTSFWVVRKDVKQYFPADLFMMMRFTNLTNDEILVDSLTVEVIDRLGEAPFKLYPLSPPDESWHTYCGPSKNLVVPCTVGACQRP
jgi:hypothetical protein